MFNTGSVAVVTGAGPGMGRAIALGFADEGVDVVLAARRRERLEPIAEEVRERGRDALVVVTDLADRDSCRNVVTTTIERFGRLDHLVQNGHHPGDWVRVADADPDAWRQIFEVNFFGALHLVQAAVAVMEPGASIVLVNSGAALRNPPTMGAYAASKAAWPAWCAPQRWNSGRRFGSTVCSSARSRARAWTTEPRPRPQRPA